MIKQNKKAFTLIELIIVIIIISILGTIAIISLQGYSKTARDSTRISDLSTMKTSLELFHLNAGKYPETTDGITITYSGNIVWTQGIFGVETKTNLDKLDRVPIDPLTEKYYSYSLTKTKQEYQLAGILEGDEIVLNNNEILDANAGKIKANAIVSGNYNGKMLKDINGTDCKILSLPSIIASDLTSDDLEVIITNGNLVYNGYNNLPPEFKDTKFKIDGGFDYRPNLANLVAYSDNGSCLDLLSNTSVGTTQRLKLFQGLKNSYSGTALASNNDFTALLSLNNNDGKQYIGNLLNNEFNTNITKDLSVGTFILASYSISDTETTTISDVCSVSPTSYTSSNPSVATISGNLITAVGSGTTNISPVGGECEDSSPKVLSVSHILPTYPFDKLTDSTVFKYDNNTSWSNITFQGYGVKDGHKTVKLYIPNGVAGVGIPLLENMSITDFTYTVYSSSYNGTHYLGFNQIPSDGDARVYNPYNYHETASIEQANLGQWKTTAFLKNKILNNNYIYISANGGEPFYVEFYVSTGGFKLSEDSIPFYKTTTITDTCFESPTSYTSSDTTVATVSGNIVTAVSSGTTLITPTSGNCTDMRGKTLTVIGTPPTDISYPFDNLVSGRDEPNFKYDNNTSWSNITFQGYGIKDGHKTVKLYIPNGVAGVGIPLLKNMSITSFTYTVYSSSVNGDHYLAVNQIPSDGDARVYNAQGAFYTSAYIEHSKLNQWKSTSFFENKILNNNYIYISSQGNEPFYVEFYVSTL